MAKSISPADEQATARLHREWLRQLPEWTGKSRTKIADEAGLARTTLTDPLKADDPGISTLSANTIDKVVRKFGVPPPGSAGDLMPRPPRGFSEDATPYKGTKGDNVSQAIEVLTGGRSGVDPWTLRTRALELEGFMPGDIVLVDLNATPQPGDMVCAQVYDWQRMKGETVMRKLQRAAPIDLLLTRSHDMTEQQPLVVDNERVVIKGVLLPHRLRAA